MKRRLLLGLCAAGVLTVVLGYSFWNEIVVASLLPDVRFDAQNVPRAPEYAYPAAWTALPGREDAADVTLPALPATDEAKTEVDVFYVHPTSYIGSSWNGPIDDPNLNANTDELSTLIQASAFNACCAIYGPRYRQAHGSALTHPSVDGDLAIDLAYRDVATAFHYYLQHHSRGRPFIIASHSQGSIHASRLIREEIAKRALRERLVVAYLPGGPIDEDTVDVPVCASAEQTGCVVSWNARGPDYEKSMFEIRGPGEALCVNPLSWKNDEALVDASLNQGAIFLHAGDENIVKGFASAQCKDGTLVVAEIGEAPRDFMSKILDHTIGPYNYHPIEYQIFYVNLRRNAQARVEAFLKRQASAPSRDISGLLEKESD